MTWEILRRTYVDKLKDIPNIKRGCFDFLYSKLLLNNIALIGLRQVGKTTLGEQLVLKYYEEQINEKSNIYEDIYYVNLAPLDDGQLHAVSDNLHNDIKMSKYKIVMIDEVQRIPNWVGVIQSLVDLNKKTKFVLTGSSALHFIKQIAVNRFHSYYVNPLSFDDYKLLWNDSNFERYLHFGSFPPINDKKSVEIQYIENVKPNVIDKILLSELPSAVIPDKFYKSLKGIKNYVGNEINKNDISLKAEVNRNTLTDYLSLMNSSRLTQYISIYNDTNQKQKVKMYLNDKSMINYLNGNNELNNNDFGALIENLVFNYLDAKYNKELFDFNIYYYKNQIEIDFIIPEEKTLIEVKYRSESTDWSSLTSNYNKYLSDDVKDFKKIMITKNTNEIVNGWKLISLLNWIKEN